MFLFSFESLDELVLKIKEELYYPHLIKWGDIESSGVKYKDIIVSTDKTLTQWDWATTSMHHRPGVGVKEVGVLLENPNPDVVLIGCGVNEQLQVRSEVRELLESKNIELKVLQTETALTEYRKLTKRGLTVGCLIHSTC